MTARWADILSGLSWIRTVSVSAQSEGSDTKIPFLDSAYGYNNFIICINQVHNAQFELPE